MAKSTSSAPRPAPVAAKPPAPPPVIHKGQVSTAGMAVQKGWSGGKK